MLVGMPRLFLKSSDFLPVFLTFRFDDPSPIPTVLQVHHHQKKDLFLDERSIHFLVGSEGKVSVFVGI
jgi:hypothetical protein